MQMCQNTDKYPDRLARSGSGMLCSGGKPESDLSFAAGWRTLPMAIAPTTWTKSLITPEIRSDSQQYTPRPKLYQDVPDEKWNDWRWQMSNRLNSMEELEQVVNLTDEEREG